MGQAWGSVDEGAAQWGGHLARHLAALSFRVPVEALGAPTRLRAPVAAARQLAMYLVHVALGVNFTRVGRLFGRDRSTVAHACQCVEDRRDDPAFDALVDTLEGTLHSLMQAEVERTVPRRKAA
jgi:hypothetical protein